MLYKFCKKVLIYLPKLILANTTSSVIMYPVVNLLKVKLVNVPLYILKILFMVMKTGIHDNIELK